MPHTASAHHEHFCASFYEALLRGDEGDHLTDVCYLNRKYRPTEAAALQEEESMLHDVEVPFCAPIWLERPYLSWPRSIDLMGLRLGHQNA